MGMAESSIFQLFTFGCLASSVVRFAFELKLLIEISDSPPAGLIASSVEIIIPVKKRGTQRIFKRLLYFSSSIYRFWHFGCCIWRTAQPRTLRALNKCFGLCIFSQTPSSFAQSNSNRNMYDIYTSTCTSHCELYTYCTCIFRELTYMYTRHERVMHTWHAPASSGFSCSLLT